ncbi:DUF4393 domain-containing protein [Bacillus sp. CMF12]|uniref:DUF4393 domain-containing protein n=1 Tax=Bacillus sp. CMF12 TaxID=2884834 RepID=UPI00207A2904|nr:DUF4393 domain-containing protein [Bacillus sp. CMF12]USK48887.1 DUF4393 domain-containing protein [Bacillus sp. CMF12]
MAAEKSLISIAAPTFLENALSEPAKEIGHSLANIFHIIFSPINYPVEKFRIKQAANLKKYEEDIQTELSKVAEEKLIEPKLSIVGPALEASKFYIDENELRKMFAKIIASSMDSDKESSVHPSFVEVIKQMSTLDAQNLKLIYGKSALPIARFRLVHSNSSSSAVLYDLVFLSNEDQDNLDLNAASLTNLNRLGLININYDRPLFDKSFYEVFSEYPIFKSLIEQISIKEDQDLKIEKGYVDITPLGRQFSSICL